MCTVVRVGTRGVNHRGGGGGRCVGVWWWCGVVVNKRGIEPHGELNKP